MFKVHDKAVIRFYKRYTGATYVDGKVVNIDDDVIVVHVDNPIKKEGEPKVKSFFFDSKTLGEKSSRNWDSRYPIDYDMEHDRITVELLSKKEARKHKAKYVLIHMKNGEQLSLYHEYESSIESLLEDDNKTLKFFNYEFTKSFVIRLDETIMFEEDVK
ncbi:hypothetical protein DIRTYBETTY_49 [Bacillus phage DirtyBetty]|uniref:Uncharacterized protein n=2 Tax=Wphvirus megatron TaxID=1987728 RepID=A0A1B1PBA3_9CAUD|nr:hypothetical protein QLX47_gp051 [Bacillus phage Eyuki]YP_009284991.1 hypothetical protein BIZ88_gp049 [Bacillus phage DirtyBetty]ALA46709.1 hypothetical protein EYUKI_51 [Bacillus phage Eyuki]ANT41435.1 hypothetical protein DIRTYBETTY_49 [Bacillus phage DirtyBetty]